MNRAPSANGTEQNFDIADFKWREEFLRATELFGRQIVDNIRGFVYALIATGEPEFINRQTLEYFG